MQLRIIRSKTNGYKKVIVEQSPLYKKLKINPFRAFSLYTNGDLPLTHCEALGTIIDAHTQTTIWKEVKALIKDIGTVHQKTVLNVR